MAEVAADQWMSDVEGPSNVALILGVPIDDVTMDETIDRIFQLVDDGKSNRRMHQIATVNVDFVVNAVRDPELRSLMRTTSLSLPDGMPIIWGSRLIGSPLRTRVAGADLVARIAERAETCGTKVVLFGAAPVVAQRAAAALVGCYPGANVTGTAGPFFRTVDELTIDDLKCLRALAPDICCVAFGNPKQELFIARFGRELGIPVMVGVGGALDFLAGERRRAPAWMQRIGLEWLHRVLTEPRRLVRRYLRDAVVFFPRLTLQALHGRPSRRIGTITIHRDHGQMVIDLTGLEAADNRAAGVIAAAIRSERTAGRHVEVHGTLAPQFRKIPGLAEFVGEAQR